MLQGVVPIDIVPFLFGARLIALLKPDTVDVRPIAVGEIVRRMASKIILARISATATSALLPRPFGVSVKCGLVAVVHIMRNVDDNPWEGGICVLQVDLAKLQQWERCWSRSG